MVTGIKAPFFNPIPTLSGIISPKYKSMTLYLVGYSLPVSSCFTFEFVTKNETPASELSGTFFTSWLRQSIKSAEPSDAITFLNRNRTNIVLKKRVL